MASRASASRFVVVEFVERRSPTQRVVLVVLVALVIAWFAARRVAMVVLDRWWFDSITDADVWRVSFVAQLQLLVGVGLLSLAVMGTSVWLVLKLGSLQTEPPNRAIQRYHQRMGPAHRWLLIGIVVFFTLRIALAATDRWQSWLLFEHGGDVGTTAPVAGGDLGFHLFRLPFLTAASNYLRQLLAFTFLLSLLGHVASGAIRMPSNRPGPSRVAVAHLAMLIAGFLAVQAFHDVFVARPSIATNRVGTFDGPGWTEMYITKPGMVVAAVVTIAAAFAAVWLARTGNWRPLAVLATVAAVVQLLVVAVLPALGERFVVQPAEAERQLWSIEDNLEATRTAYDLDDVSSEPLEEVAIAGAAEEQLAADVARVQLFDTATMANTLQVLVGTRGTRISDTDIDRYSVDGRSSPTFVAARSANRTDVPESGWVQEHLVYTHGDGLVVVPADRVDADGRPDVTAFPDAFGAGDTPLYFGESLDRWYVIVDTQRAQLDGTQFEGEGVAMSTFGQRLVLSLAVGEWQPLFTSELTPDSELLYRRSVRERVGNLAPFLRLDSDPYPVVVDGSVDWVIDGYTTSSTYPSSQFTSGAGLGGSFNAVRASVKATVDAETGETHLYRTDGGDDPIIDAWDRIFPGLLEASDAIPEGLRPHLRYPTDLWKVQSSLLGRYHVRTAEELFNGTGRWAVSAAPASTVGDQTVAPSPPVDQYSPLAAAADDFGTTRPYGPGSATNPTSTRDELAALALADHELDGSIHLAVPDAGRPPLPSPQVAQSAIDADPELARAITLLNANGSKVQFGPMTPVIIEDGVVWVRPIIVIGTGAAAAPRLYGVAATTKGLVAVEATTLEAVAAVTSDDL